MKKYLRPVFDRHALMTKKRNFSLTKIGYAKHVFMFELGLAQPYELVYWA